MTTEPFDVLPLWLLILVFGLALWAALEAGYRWGRWRHARMPDEQVQQVGAIVASILGLLALVLGFTFSFAASRFDARRQAVLEEANAIGTTYLRTRLLPPEMRQKSAKALREYVDVRLAGVRSGDPTAAIARSEELHEVLWSQATLAGEQEPSSEMVALYIDALNNLIDMHAVRVQAGTRSRIPAVMWTGLLVMSLLSMGAVGYQAGLSNTSRSPVKLVMIFAFTIVLALIADLDRSQEGLLRVGQQALVDVQNSMKSSPP
jgi:hypothetical protein